MERVLEFLNNAKTWYLATVDEQGMIVNLKLSHGGCGQNPGPNRRCPHNVYARANDGCCGNIHAVT